MVGSGVCEAVGVGEGSGVIPGGTLVGVLVGVGEAVKVGDGLGVQASTRAGGKTRSAAKNGQLDGIQQSTFHIK